VLVLQKLLDNSAADFQRPFRLEQRRDIDLVFHAEQFGEVECGQGSKGILAFSDQEANRGRSVAVFQHLRNDHEQLLD